MTLSLRRREVEQEAQKSKTEVLQTCARRILESLKEYETLAFGLSWRIVPADSTLRVAYPTTLNPGATLTERMKNIFRRLNSVSKEKMSKDVEDLRATIERDLCLVFDLDSSASSAAKTQALSFLFTRLSPQATAQQGREGAELAVELARVIETDNKGTFRTSPTGGGGFSGSPLVDSQNEVVGIFARATKTHISKVEYTPLNGVFIDAPTIRRFLESAKISISHPKP